VPCAAQLAAADQSVERRASTLQTRAAPSCPCGSGSALVLAAWQVAADWLQIGQQSVAGSSKGAGGCIVPSTGIISHVPWSSAFVAPPGATACWLMVVISRLFL
jgi:hypothetical protein